MSAPTKREVVLLLESSLASAKGALALLEKLDDASMDDVEFLTAGPFRSQRERVQVAIFGLERAVEDLREK